MTPLRRARRALLNRLSRDERTTVLEALHNETTGGFLLLLAAAVALVWASSPWSAGYADLQDTVVGPAALHLDLSLQDWAADGLLAVFFLVAGLELKREFVLGDLRERSEAVLPVVAAVCGMVFPVLVYVGLNLALDGDLSGWAVPIATDIAFALAVLAVMGSHLPTTLRAFLLSLAVVDDLLAILVIALFFTDSLSWAPLVAAVVLLGLYALLQRRRVTAWWLYVPLGLAIWTLVHASGVHATVAGVAIALLTRVRRDPGELRSPAELLEHRVRPWSAGVCVPLFALLSAGVALSFRSIGESFSEPVALGVVLGLVVGKAVGVFGGTWITARFTRAELNPGLAWPDVLGVALLAGIGFTVSLLIGELAFEGDAAATALVTTAVLEGSVIAAVLAIVVLLSRNAAHRRLQETDDGDEVADGQPGRPAGS